MSKENDRKTWDTEIGSKALVEHLDLKNTPEMEALREVLSDIGRDLQRIEVAPKDYTYMGSFSVHCYASEGLKGNFAFVSLCHPHKTYFMLAEAAGKKLSGDIQKMFRGSMQKLRSGFANG